MTGRLPDNLVAMLERGHLEQVQPGVFRRPERHRRMPSRAEVYAPAVWPRVTRRHPSPEYLKAARLLATGGVLELVVDRGAVRAVVQGDHGTYQAGWRDGAWFCSCPHDRVCSHLHAVRRIANPPGVRHPDHQTPSTTNPRRTA